MYRKASGVELAMWTKSVDCDVVMYCRHNAQHMWRQLGQVRVLHWVECRSLAPQPTGHGKYLVKPSSAFSSSFGSAINERERSGCKKVPGEMDKFLERRAVRMFPKTVVHTVCARRFSAVSGRNPHVTHQMAGGVELAMGSGVLRMMFGGMRLIRVAKVSALPGGSGTRKCGG